MKKLKFCSFLCALFLLMLSTGLTTWAATPKNKWVEDNGYYYYYNAKGQKVTGQTKINGKYYYFNKNGKQLHGWRKIDGSYYCFNRVPGAKGYRLANTKLDRLTIGADGKAVVKTALQKKIATALVDYARWCDKTVKFTWSDEKKLKAVAKQINPDTCRYRNLDDCDWKTNSNWHVNLALEAYDCYVHHYGCFECQRTACAFSYLAVAAGFKNVDLHIGGSSHGWVSIGKRMFDPMKIWNNGGKLVEFTAADQKTNSFYKNVKCYNLN